MRHRVVGWVIVTLPVLVLAERGWSRRHMSDDGYIHLRVVKQLLAGHGPVFNVGERVEASTSPLWVFILAVADVVTPVRLEWIAVLLGLGLTLAGVTAAIVGARGLNRTKKGVGLLVPAGLLLLAVYPPNWVFATSGLEGGLALAWLGACFVLLVRWARERQSAPPVLAVAVGAGPLIRPDLGIFTLFFLLTLIVGTWGRSSRREQVRTVALVLAAPVLYELFRLGYYGSPVPNPAIAKEATRARWDSGWDYLQRALSDYWIWFPLVVLACGAYVPLLRRLARGTDRRAALVVVAFGLGGIAHALYVVRVGGDFMHARLLLPSLFAIAAPVAVVPLDRRYLPALLVVPWALVALCFLPSPTDTRHFFFTLKSRPVTVEDFNWGRKGLARFYTGHGVYYNADQIRARPAPGRDGAVVSYGIGISSYALGNDVYVLDALGLADPFTAHLELRVRGYPGHEKPLPPPWVVARLTAPSSTVDEQVFRGGLGWGINPIDDPRGVPFDRRVTDARAVLECPAVVDLQRSYTGRLTPGRFIDNIVHALRRSRLRIPPEPAVARARLCRASSHAWGSVEAGVEVSGLEPPTSTLRT
jgi:arabinofuranosyltransferase